MMIGSLVRIIMTIFLLLVAHGIQSADAFQWRWINPLPQGSTLYSAWLHPSGEMFWVGEQGAMLRSDGERTISVFTGTRRNLLGVWGIQGGPLFIVGEKGTLLRYSEGVIERMDSGTANDLYGVWGTSPLDVFAVGAQGTLLHFDGVRWNPQQTGLSVALYAIWGTGPGNYYAVGDGGTIRRFDGERWRPIESPTTSLLRSIAGTSPNDIYVVGDGGTALHFDGLNWQQLNTGRNTLQLNSVWAIRPDEIIVAGGVPSTSDTPGYGAILEYNGLRGYPWPMRREERFLYHVAGAEGGRAIAVGEAGRIFIRQGSAWEAMSRAGFTSAIQSLWGVGDRLLMASIDRGRVVIFDAQGSRETFLDINERVNDLWGTDSANVYAVGDAGGIYRFNGTRWATMLSPAFWPLRGIWGSSSTNIYAVGEGSTILHFDGDEWRSLAFNPETHILTDIWGSGSGHLFVTGGDGKIWRFDGNRWWVYQNSTVRTFLAVHGSGPDNVYAVGTGGHIAHWNGSEWTVVKPPAVDTDLTAVWVLGERDVFVAGGSGKIYRFNGVAWIPLPISAPVKINALWSAGGKMFLAGERGVLLWNDSLNFPALALTLNGEIFRSGELDFMAFLSTFPGQFRNIVDLYVVINLPGGSFVNYGIGDGSITPVLRNFTVVPTAFPLGIGSVRGLRFGNYSIMALMVNAGRNPLDASAWVDWDWASFSYYD